MWQLASVTIQAIYPAPRRRAGSVVRSQLPQAAEPQAPPGSAEKYFSNLPSSPLNSSASSGGGRFRVMLGQALE